MFVDALGARALAGMVLTPQSQDILSPASEKLETLHKWPFFNMVNEIS